MDQIKVSNGEASVGDHVQLDMNSWQWDTSKPIGPDNQPKMNGPVIRACGKIIEVFEDESGRRLVLVETGMDRVSCLPGELTKTDMHANEGIVR